MTLKFIGRNSNPNYIAESSDIVDNKIAGANIIGGTIYLLDVDSWRIVEEDTTIGEYSVVGDNVPVTIIAPLESNGAIPVNVQDQHSEIIDLFLHNNLGTFSLASPTSLGDTVLSLEAEHGVIAGEIVCIKEGASYFQGDVISVNINDITLDSPMDNTYTVAAHCHRGITNMAVDGSSSPIVFHIRPPDEADWDVVRMNFHIEDSTAMDDGTFGGTDALTNGVVVQVRNGTYKNIFNVKTNGDFAERCHPREYVDKPPAGTGYAMNAHRVFGGQGQNGVTVRLVGADEEALVIIIQDDLTDLDIFRVIAQGHTVTD